MAPQLRSLFESSSLETSSVERHRLRIKLFRDAATATFRAAGRQLGIELVGECERLGVFDALVPPAALPTLLALDDVRWIEPMPPAYASANNGMRLDADVDPVQLMGLTGTGILIGQWDSGVADSTHPDLVGRVTVGEPSLLTTPHATHVAGIAMGDGTNSLNQGGREFQWRGVAMAASVVAFDVPEAVAEVDTAIQLFDIDVANNSWTYIVDATNCWLYGDYASDAPEFDEIVCGGYGKALPIVFSAGNERDDGDCGIDTTGGYSCLPPPGTAKNVISVGAHQSDMQYMTQFSSWGPTDDGRMKPDVSAPGCEVFNDNGVTSTSFGGAYISSCGTSAAAPVVTGAIAVLLEQWRALYTPDPLPSTYKALLGGFAKDRSHPGPDYRYGLGAISLERSTLALQTSSTVEASLDDSQTDTYDFFIPAGVETLAVTLAWDDPPGAELADTVLVNDLDLELVGPTSGTHLPFVLDPEDPNADATVGRNALDNLEQVRVLSPETGLWTVRVIGTLVPEGPQAYSLVGFDARPPADPASFTAQAINDTTIELTWIRPGDADRASTVVARSTSPVTWTPELGTTYETGQEPVTGVYLLYVGDDDYSTTPLVDSPLDPGVLYHYAAFSCDGIPNYSAGVSDTAQTSADLVSVEPRAAAAGKVKFARTGRNPFRDEVTFRFELPAPAVVAVDVYDAGGRHVAGLIRGERQAGSHEIVWRGRETNGARAAAGVYFVRFRSTELTSTEKVVYLR